MSGAQVAENAAICRARGGWADYLAIARLDHSTKHVFVVPGIVLALVLRHAGQPLPLTTMVLGLVTLICIASANYVINEWLDREFDRHHPTKSQRSAVQRDLRGEIVQAEWALLVLVGLTSAWLASGAMFAVAGVFALQGVVYNVPPIRTKNLAFFDVISESINNPLRLMIGWAMIDPTTLPPSSIILAYWAGGAFLMAAKRLSEYREIVATHGKATLARYRASFAHYDDVSLTVSCCFYAMLSTFFLAIFLIKYRIEYLVVFPPIIAMFGYYLAISMRPGSLAQKPERLFRERTLMLLSALIAALFVLTTIVDMPVLAGLTAQRYIALG